MVFDEASPQLYYEIWIKWKNQQKKNEDMNWKRD